MHISIVSYGVYITYPSATLSFHRPCNIWRGIAITKLLIIKVSSPLCSFDSELQVLCVKEK